MDFNNLSTTRCLLVVLSAKKHQLRRLQWNSYYNNSKAAEPIGTQNLELNTTSNTTLDLGRKYVSIDISTFIVQFWYNTV